MSRELSIRNYDPQLYIQTNLGNKISKRCHIHGSQTIVLAGNVSYLYFNYDYCTHL